MTEFHYEMRMAAATGRDCQDYAEVERLSDGSLRLALADGVSGMSGGLEAATQAVQSWTKAKSLAPELALAEADSLLSRASHGGQTTAIYLELTPDSLQGASLGDSCVWFLEANGTWTELTEYQRRKPYLGSGEAVPIAFFRVPRESGRVLICSDGLWRFMDLADIWANAFLDPLAKAADALLNKPPYMDDVSLVLVAWGAGGLE